MAVIIDGTTGITTPTESVTTTVGVGGATPSASGAGITFPATQSASSNANTLDDYEEGTWTPAFNPSSSGSITGGTVYATYTKIGRVVSIQVFMGGTWVISSPTGQLRITGLPFAAPAVTSGISAFGVAPYSMNAGVDSISAETDISQARLIVFCFSNGVRIDVSTYIKTDTQLLIGGTYAI